MKLYLSGWEADLMEKALKQIEAKGGQDSELARKLLDRMEDCKELQKPHKTHLTRAERCSAETPDR